MRLQFKSLSSQAMNFERGADWFPSRGRQLEGERTHCDIVARGIVALHGTAIFVVRK